MSCLDCDNCIQSRDRATQLDKSLVQLDGGALPNPAPVELRTTPVQERARGRVDAILAVAGTLLEEVPLERLSTQMIADRAGVPIGSVYRYFPNKNAIVAEYARHAMLEADKSLLMQITQELGVLPWREAIDHTVDVVIRAYQEQPGYAKLLLTLRSTTEFKHITDESNARVAQMFVLHPAVKQMIAADKIELVSHAAVIAANALQDWALCEADPSKAMAIAGEIKTLLKAYLACHIDEGA